MEELIVRDACNLVLTSALVLCDPPNVQCPSCNLQIVQQKSGLFFYVFSFFFPFFEIAWVPLGGFHPHYLAWAPLRGFHPRILYYYYYYFLFFFFGAQNVDGVEIGACSTTSIDLSRISMNSCLERGFL